MGTENGPEIEMCVWETAAFDRTGHTVQSLSAYILQKTAPTLVHVWLREDLMEYRDRRPCSLPHRVQNRAVKSRGWPSGLVGCMLPFRGPDSALNAYMRPF
jgi:hypothetical protein